MYRKALVFSVFASALWASLWAQNSSKSANLTLTISNTSSLLPAQPALDIDREKNPSVNGELVNGHNSSQLITEETNLLGNSSGSNALSENSTTPKLYKSDPSGKGTPGAEHESNLLRMAWLSEIFGEAKKKFDMLSRVSEECKRDYETYKQHVRNQTVWAVRMMESSEWPEVGLLSGSTFQFGGYAECLKSEAPKFRGKYCSVSTTLWLNNGKSISKSVGRHEPKWTHWPDENFSAWDVIKEYESNPARVSRLWFMWAVCIPASCNAADLKMSVSRALIPVLNANRLFGMVYSSNSYCQVHEVLQYPKSFYIGRSVLIFLIVLVTLGTLCDGFHRNSECGSENGDYAQTRWSLELLRCFSVKKNCEALIQNSEHTFPILYILKLVLLYFVIAGHAFLFIGFFPKFNTEQLEMIYNPRFFELLGTVSINGFFMISGFLSAYFGMAKSKDTGFFHILLTLVCRWLRLVPAYGLVLFIYTSILPYLGDGPLWKHHAEQDMITPCASNWWTNLLMINNIVDPTNMCMQHSWYIAVDYHLSVVSSLLVFICSKNKKVGIFLMIVSSVGSDIVTFLRIYRDDIYGITVNIMTLKPNNPIFAHHDKIYRMTYFRSSPYFLGFATALVTNALREKGYTFSPIQKAFLLIPSFVIGFGAQWYAFVFYKIDRPYDAMENAVYGVLHRILVVLPLAFLICISLVSGLGVPTKLVGFKLYIPLGRLVYCMYLVSYILQDYHVYSSKKPLTGMSRTELYWIIGTDILYSIILAFFLFLIAEGPASGILTLLHQNFISKKIKPTRKMDPACVTKSISID